MIASQSNIGPAHAEIGPSCASRGAVHRLARDVRALAQIAVECSTDSAMLDVARAQKCLVKAAALLGPAAGDASDD